MPSDKRRLAELSAAVSTAASSWAEAREGDPDEARRRRTALENAIRAAYSSGIEVDDIVRLTASDNEAGGLTPEQVVAILI